MDRRRPARHRRLSAARTLLLVVAIGAAALLGGLSQPAPAADDDAGWAVYNLDTEDYGGLGLIVAREDEVEDILVCSLSGGGLCEGDNADKTLGDYLGEPPVALGPFDSQAKAIRAYCTNVVPDTTHVLPLAAGTRAQFRFDGKEHDVENGPGCDSIPVDTGDGTETTTSGTGTATETTEPERCTVRGTATDHEGRPLAGVHLLLTFGFGQQETAADSQGRYVFDDEIGGDATMEFDPASDSVYVSLVLEEAKHDPGRFMVLVEQRKSIVRSDEFKLTPEEDCRRDFDFRSLPDTYRYVWPGEPHWRHITEIYHRFQDAFDLADMLKMRMDYGLPLKVYAFDSADDPLGRGDFAYWRGTTSNGSQFLPAPYIGLGDDTSLLSDGGWPDNREYHEFGHHFLADSFGDAIPKAAANTNHAGYYRNPTSTDAFTEGFAEFFSMMVSKHVDERPMPELYRLDGSYVDLEGDYRAWYGRGWGEEMALAGILLDMEDGPGDYASGRDRPKLAVGWHKVVDDAGQGRLIVGQVVNLTRTRKGMSEQTMVVAEFVDGTGKKVRVDVAPTIPWDLPGNGGRGLFVMPVPPDLTYADVRLAAYEGRPGDVLTDDDPIDVSLEDLWWTIYRHQSENQESNYYLFDVSELYAALHGKFGERDGDRDGMDDVTQVFVAHGFFADANGDLSYANKDAVGRSDHPASDEFPARLPRNDAPPLQTGMAKLDVGDVDGATALVHVAYEKPDEHRGYSYVAEPDEDGSVYVSMPPPEAKATATVVALAPGYLPAIAGTVDNADFWKHAEKGDGKPYLRFEAELERGSVGVTVTTHPYRSRAYAAFAGGGLLVLAGLIGLVVAFRSRRRP